MSAEHAHGPGSTATLLGVPAVPPKSTVADGPVAFTAGHHFAAAPDADLDALVESMSVPLSVILQVTKRCNFDCSFCSEILQMPDPTLGDLERMRTNLAGVRRVFLSGGEPLMRRDFGDVLDLFAHEFVVGVPTNATRGHVHVDRMVGRVDYVNVGLEGPRAITNRVRGDYDAVMDGIRAFDEAGIPVSLSAVVYRSTLTGLPSLVQIADVLRAGKVKLIMPLRKGNALDLPDTEFITNAEAETTFSTLTQLRMSFGWRPALRMTTWTPETEGHMIVVEPTGAAQAWPVYNAPDLFQPLGNVLDEPIEEIWARYPYKRAHLAKYLGRSIQTVGHADTEALNA